MNMPEINLTPARGDLGTNVVYISSKGQQKVAMVLGTPDSIEDGTSIPKPVGNQRNLLVFAPNGTAYLRVCVQGAEDVAKLVAELGELDAPATNYWI